MLRVRRYSGQWFALVRPERVLIETRTQAMLRVRRYTGQWFALGSPGRVLIETEPLRWQGAPKKHAESHVGLEVVGEEVVGEEVCTKRGEICRRDVLGQ